MNDIIITAVATLLVSAAFYYFSRLISPELKQKRKVIKTVIPIYETALKEADNMDNDTFFKYLVGNNIHLGVCKLISSLFKDYNPYVQTWIERNIDNDSGFWSEPPLIINTDTKPTDEEQKDAFKNTLQIRIDILKKELKLKD